MREPLGSECASSARSASGPEGAASAASAYRLAIPVRLADARTRVVVVVGVAIAVMMGYAALADAAATPRL